MLETSIVGSLPKPPWLPEPTRIALMNAHAVIAQERETVWPFDPAQLAAANINPNTACLAYTPDGRLSLVVSGNGSRSGGRGPKTKRFTFS